MSVWTVCRGVGKPGTDAEGKLAELRLSMPPSSAQAWVRQWSDDPQQWAKMAELFAADPEARLADFEWKFTEENRVERWYSAPDGTADFMVTEPEAARPVAHVAGMMLVIRGKARQCCAWCGTLLYEIEMDPAEVGQLGNSLVLPGYWYQLDPADTLADGQPAFRSLHTEATEIEPDNACTRLADGG